LRAPHLILGVGELLWDIVADTDQASNPSLGPTAAGRTLGGAPANFTVMAGRLGNHAAILSRIGRDALGRQAIDCLDPLPVDTSLLEVDPAHETGRVSVSFSAGEPRYTIHEPAAWDFLELSDEWVKTAERAAAICFGTLAQRATASRQTIQTLVAQTPASCDRIFDVNLRAPFYSGEVIEESLELASVIKMNADEARVILELTGLAAGEEPPRHRLRLNTKYLRSCAERLLAEFPALEMVAITRGSQGSLLETRGEWSEHPGYPVKVGDAIGAGDAFTAALAHYRLRKASLETLNEAGNRWGGWIASQPGAMPELPEAVRDAISASIMNKSSQ
jgi:fructokinase